MILSGHNLDSNKRLQHAHIALEGLSVGDAFGDQLPLKPEKYQPILENRTLRPAPWQWTDDTNMACSIYSILRQYGEINQDELARDFANHYDVKLGYGPYTHRKMIAIRDKKTYWRDIMFDGYQNTGSFGNGGAMRVAPIGGYFADDYETVVEQAKKSSEVTHAHPEGIAGTIAVAVATAYMFHCKENQTKPTSTEFLKAVHQYTPDSEVREKIRQAVEFDKAITIVEVAEKLGNGTYITAQDTVPFCLWCASKHLTNYEEALWFTLGSSNDRDTNCAIVGGIVAGYVGFDGIPEQWRTAREPLPDWINS